MAAEKLRDLSQPIDVALLDATVAAFYGTGSKEERSAADLILRDLQNNPDMWLQVVHILSSTQNLNTKFFALQVLENVIKYRWNALPVEQRDGMKNYISEVIVKLSSDEISFRHERLYVNKLNIILVQILKHEWPARWRSFIPDLVAAAKTSETICENCMAILKLLSEEVFDFSRGAMTQQKIKELKQSLNSEFQLIHELGLYVLSASQRAELIRATMATLHAFLSWIPLGYIFESPLTNCSVASSLGTHFLTQISRIFLDMLNVYRMYSELISTSIAQGGPYASRTSVVKLLRAVKRETLKLIETFLDKAEDQPHIGKQFVPPMMDPVLGVYARNVPDARESEVLSLFATIINKYKGAMLEDVPKIFEAVFQCTLEMITKNFEDYPEHRLKFFSLLRAIATHCFPALIHLSSELLKLVMDSIIWAFRHTERNIAETGLNLLLEMLKNFKASEFCNQFYRTYFLTIEQEIFVVLTDTFHKPGFKLHVLLLQHLFCLVESGRLTEPLWDAATVTYPNNSVFIREYTIKLLSTSFPNMTTAEVTQFVNGLFESRGDLPSFKNHIRDFLVQSKGFSAQNNKDLYAEEAAVQREKERQRMLSIPGLIAPNEIQDEMVDS